MMPVDYTQLPSGSIRLLCKSASGSESKWSLIQTPLKDADTFIAISYVWGDEKPTKTLRIDQSELSVTPSLGTLLKVLEARPDIQRVWVDQICINQTSSSEVADQVKLMREIYMSAQRVLVWLGPSTDSSDFAMDRIPALNETLRASPGSTSRSPNAPGVDDPIWPALVDLYDRSWYDRLWIQQEVLLAKDIEVLCGAKSMAWSLFSSFTIKIYDPIPSGLLQAFDKRSGGWSHAGKRHMPGYVSVRNIETMRDSENDGIKPPFWTYLSMGQLCRVTKPLDRVYGLLGLLNLKDAVNLVNVRYDWEPWEGYLQFAKVYIERDPDLGLLGMAGNVSKPKELPSWCPNFDSQPNVASIYCNYPQFCAGFKPGEPRVSRVQTSATSNIIKIPGFHMDKVKAVTDSTNPLMDSQAAWDGPDGQGAKHEMFHFECFELFSQVFRRTITEEQAIYRTLVAGHLTRNRPLPAGNMSQLHLVLLKTWTAMATGGEIPIIPPSVQDAVGKWVSALGMQAFRRFFVTEAGRIGLGPGDVQKGDDICVFYSAGPLYLLRYANPNEPAKLVGDAYVDGLMELETMPTGTRGKDEIFSIA